jgi:galactoside O-acetyltransferase
LGKDTLIDQGVEINRPDRVDIGNNCHIERGVLLSVGSDGGEIVIEDGVLLGAFSHIAGRGGVRIGEFTATGANVHIYSVTNLPYHMERLGELVSMSHTIPVSQQSVEESSVDIGSYVFLGYGSLILPGTSIGDGTIVHALAEVSGGFPAFAILSGHGPAKQKGWRRPAAIDPRLDADDNSISAR